MKKKVLLIAVTSFIVILLTALVCVISGVKKVKTKAYEKHLFLENKSTTKEVLTEKVKFISKKYVYLKNINSKNFTLEAFLSDDYIYLFFTKVNWENIKSEFSYKTLPTFVLKYDGEELKTTAFKDLYDLEAKPKKDKDGVKRKKSSLLYFKFNKCDALNMKLFLDSNLLLEGNVEFQFGQLNEGYQNSLKKAGFFKWFFQKYVWWISLISVLVLGFLGFVILKSYFDSKKINVSAIAEGAFYAGLALVFDFLASLYSGFIWPMGGSISLAMIPIAIMGFKYGLFVGIATGLIVGATQILWASSSSIVHPAQVFLDYILSYGAIGLTGLFSSKYYKEYVKKEAVSFVVVTGFLFVVFIRYISHVLSGAIFFSAYVPLDSSGNPLYSAIVYSMIYNFGYLFISSILSIIILIILTRTLKIILFDQNTTLKYQKKILF